MSKPDENKENPNEFSSDDDTYADADEDGFMTASSSADVLNREGTTTSNTRVDDQVKRPKSAVDMDLD